MNDQPNLEKRIKRHIWGQKFDLEILTDSAFRPQTLGELEGLGFSEWVPSTWGIQGKGSVHDLYRLNCQLATPGRIVIEVAQFKAGAREQLFRRARVLPWELWFGTNQGLDFDIRTYFEAALIHHEGLGKQALEEAIRARLVEFGGLLPAEARTQRMYLSIRGSQVHVSLDTTGEHLRKRGYRIAPGPAPLGENRTAAIIRKIAEVHPEPQWILDGMTGSGTFAFESSLFFSGVSAGGGRQFAFSQWPSYRESTKNFWSRQITPRSAVPQIWANDLDLKSIGATGVNLEHFRKLYGVLVPEPRFVLGDFFSLRPQDMNLDGPGWVFLNPPYDHRIPGSLDRLALNLDRWIEETTLKGTLVILLPHGKTPEKFAARPRVFEDLVFNHGGRPVTLLGLSLS